MKYRVIIYHYPSDCVLSAEYDSRMEAFTIAAVLLKFFDGYVLNKEKSTNEKWVYEYEFAGEVGHVEVKEV